MFITKKRHKIEMRRLESEIEALETEVNHLDSRAAVSAQQKHKLLAALEFIAEQRTESANATVTRMADRAEKALGRGDKAKFVTDAPNKPEGTLADLRRQFFGVSGSAARSDLSYTYGYPVIATPWEAGSVGNNNDSISELASSGGDFGGGGSTGSWSDSSSSCDSSSSDSGGDSGGGCD